MFNLEQSILEWRKQMLAAGIKSPVPLEELEIHLREETGWQMKIELNEAKAFDIAVKKIGRPHLLKTEFKKAGCVRSFISAHRVLGILWMALCGIPSIFFLWEFLQIRHAIPVVTFKLDFDLAVLFCVLAFAGALAGLPLFCGSQRARRFIILIAVLNVITTITWVAAFKSFSMLIGAFDFLSLVSVVLLLAERSAKRLERKRADAPDRFDM